MGIILTRFRRKKQTTLEILEDLETKIKHIEEHRLSTEQQYRRIIGLLMLYSVGLFVLGILLFYFYLTPASQNDLLIYATPLLVFPFIIWFLKRLVSWYYHRKIASNQKKLVDMKNRKKQLLEEVMEKETYKVAKQILEKFAPDQLRKTPTIPVKPGLESALSSIKSPGVPSTNMVPGGTVPSGPPVLPAMDGVLRHRSSMPKSPMSSPGTLIRPGYVAREWTSTSPLEISDKSLPPGPPIPRQILPRERGMMDKLMEYLVGDGPSNRYALICRQCDSHNGMALKEEFEHLSFRCCYCYYWNPSRKQRPQAPRLMPPSPEHTSASELESGSSTTEDEESEGESGSASLVSQKEDEKENELPQSPNDTTESGYMEAHTNSPDPLKESEPSHEYQPSSEENGSPSNDKLEQHVDAAVKDEDSPVTQITDLSSSVQLSDS